MNIELGSSVTNIFSRFNNLRYVCQNIHNVFNTNVLSIRSICPI